MTSRSGPDQTPQLAVVLVNFHTLPDVRRALSQPVMQEATQIIVVDNASDPADISALCQEHSADAILLTTNTGFAGGVNAGLEVLTDGIEQVLLLNPDVALDPMTLAALRSALLTCDAAAPLLVEPSGRLQVGAAGGPVSVRSFATYFLGLAHVAPSLRGICLTRRQSRTASRVDWLSMACLCVRRDAFATYGRVPTDELVYAEDVAWGTAATARGARFLLVPGVQVPHGHGAAGASAAWTGSLGRLAVRRLGRRRGAVAVAMMRLGLGLRGVLGRRPSAGAAG